MRKLLLVLVGVVAIVGWSSDIGQSQATLQVHVGTLGGIPQAASVAAQPTGLFEAPPAEETITVVGPNTKTVFNWPIIQDIPISGNWGSGPVGERAYLGWPAISHDTWPDLDVAGGIRFGNVWVVYPVRTETTVSWFAQHVEWIRSPHERRGTQFPFQVKLLQDTPAHDSPIGLFIAGPSRHVTDQPEYRRRTAIKWFRYGDLTRWNWSTAAAVAPNPGTGGALQRVEVLVKRITVWNSTTGQLDVAGFGEINRTLNLVEFRGTATQVAAGVVPSGPVIVSLEVEPVLVRVNDLQYPLTFSQEHTGYLGGQTIRVGNVTATSKLLFSFDDLTENADGSWTLTPIVTHVKLGQPEEVGGQ